MFYWFFKNSKKYKIFLEYKDILEYEIKLLIEYNIKDFLNKQKDIDFISKNIRKYYTLLAKKLINSSKMKYDDNQRILIFKQMLSSINSSCYYMLSQNVSHNECDKIITKTINYLIKYLETYPNIDIQEDSFHTLYLQHAFMIAYFQVKSKNTRDRFKKYKKDIIRLHQEAINEMPEEFTNTKDLNFLLKSIYKYGMLTAKKVINNKKLLYSDKNKTMLHWTVMSYIASRGTLMLQNKIPHKYCDRFFESIMNKTIELAILKGDTVFKTHKEFFDFVKPYIKRLCQYYSDEYEKDKMKNFI